MRLDEFQTERTRIISEMLDNPDIYGIYSTTKCFEALDSLFLSINQTKDNQKVKTAEEILAKYWIEIVEGAHVIFHKDALKAMEEYLNQGIPEIMDEEIERFAQELYKTGMALEDESPKTNSWKSLMLHSAQGYRAGAKWYRNRIRFFLKRITS